MLLELLGTAALLVTTLLAGVHLTGIAGLNPAMRSLDVGGYLAIKQAADREFPKIARPLMLGSLALTGAFSVLAAADGRSGVAAISGVALLALVLTLLAILRGDLPLNRQMAAWTTAGVPADWTDVRRRWESFFAAHTAANVLALLCLVAALLLAR